MTPSGGDSHKGPGAGERAEDQEMDREMSIEEGQRTEQRPERLREEGRPPEEELGWETDISEEEMEQLVGKEPPPRGGEGGALRRDWKLLPRMLPYLRPHKRFAAASIVATILMALVTLAEPWPLAFVIDGVLGSDPIPGWVTAIVGDGVGKLILFAVIATLVLTLLSGGLTVVNEYLSTTVNQYMTLDFRSDLVQHVQRLSLSYHEGARTGILMYRLNQQSGAIGQIVTGLPTIAQSVLTIGGMAFITFTIDPLLALIALGVTPFIFYSTNFYADRIEPRLYRVRGLEAMNLAIVHEMVQMLRVVLAFGRERREYWRFRNQGEKAVRARVDLTVRQTAFQLGVQLITAMGTAAVLGVGAHLALQGRISPGELLVVLTYVAAVYQPMEEVTQTIATYQQQFIAFRHASDLLEEAPQVTEKPDARAIERVRGEIELEGVEFAYEQREPVLKDINIRVPAGEAVAIVGPTGAGKSTLASLLPRFYDPDQGRVLIDGIDLRDLTLDSLRGQFSIVLQEPLLFQTSILENIRYGKPTATDEEVEAAAKAANAHDFITQLPDGYESTLGERGAKISGGERQRIAVARAFLRDAPILILDEPTSSIDSRTESVILDALDRLKEGRTTIVIAHRLSTLRDVDRILVLNQGRLVEQGSEEELLAKHGLYRQMWEAQTGLEGVETPDAAPRPLSSGNGPGEGGREAGTGDTRLRELMAQIADAERRKSEAEERTRRALESVSRAAPAGRRVPATVGSRPKIVLLGMLTRIPVAGVGWLVGQYAEGFRRLGYEVYYVEAHARTPQMLMTHKDDDGAAKAARFISGVARRFGLGDRWAFQALHDSGRCYGMSPEQLDRLYRDAALIVNMHGGTLPLPEHADTDRLVYLGTDPVEVELELDRGDRRALELLDHHVAFFTWGLNIGNPTCRLPWTRPFPFVPSPPPVVMDFWDNDVEPDRAPFTTIGNWRQRWRNVRHQGRLYRWSKHHEFLKILDLPRKAGAPIELALASYDDHDHLMLAEHGWRVRPGPELSRDLDSYRDYIVGSSGELSVAKEQNVHFRSGWFSERSATYLAAGRPVIVQDTGFGAALPTGEGLFAFADIDGAAAAIAEVQANPARHRRAAREIAREYLSHEVVLGDMLDHLGLEHRGRRRGRRQPHTRPRIPPKLSLENSRQSPALPEATVNRVERRPVPTVRPPDGTPVASIVITVRDDLARTRLALESVLANTGQPAHEIIVVDDGSKDPAREYLEVLAARNRHVRLIREESKAGFAAACNQGLRASRGDVVVVLNNETVVPPGWLTELVDRLEDPAIGMVGPTTNGWGGAAQASPPYETYGEFLRFAQERVDSGDGRLVDIGVVDMSCAALRQDVLQQVGPLDDRLEDGVFEEDGYARRVRDSGYRVVCAEDLFVHHFGRASLETERPDDRRYAAGASRADSAVREHAPERSTSDQPPGGNGEVSAPVQERRVEPDLRGWVVAAWLGTIVAVGLALRGLAAQDSLFGDELFSYFVTTQAPISGVFDRIELTEATPPLYYILGWLSSKLGDPTTLIRLPSVLAGTAAVPVIYLLGKRFGRHSIGLIAAALVATLPFTVFYGSEARAYALLLFLVPLSTLALLRALDGDRRLWWGIYWLAAALVLYTHFIGALAIAVQAAWALWAERRQWRWILAVNAAAALAFVPWLGMLDSSVDSLGIAEFLRPLTAANVVSDTGDALFGHPYANLNKVPGLVSLFMLGVATVIAAATFVVSRRGESDASDVAAPSRSRRSRRELVLLGLLVVMPPLLVLAYSIAETSIYLSRNLTTVIPYLCLLVALTLAALPRRAMIAVTTLAIVAALFGSVRMVLDYPRPDLGAAAEEIERRAPPGTPVIQPLGYGGGNLSPGAPPPEARSGPVAGAPPPQARSAPVAPVADRGLEIYLDDKYPLSHDLEGMKRQPRGKDFFVVLPHPSFFGPVRREADAAGAEVTGGLDFDGFHRVFVRRFTR